MSRIARITLAVCLGFSSLGCMTAMTVMHAKDPRPRTGDYRSISEAALLGDVLYVKLGGSYPSVVQDAPIATVGLDDLRRHAPLRKLEVDEYDGYPRLPIRLTGLKTFPDAATRILVTGLLVDDFHDLKTQVEARATKAQLFLVDFKGPGPKFASHRPGHSRLGDANTMIALVLPRDPESPAMTLTYDFVEVPTARRALWLLTPLTLAGDIVTAPLQIILALLWGEC